MAKGVRMKWCKFLELQSQYPSLVNDLRWCGATRNRLKEFVRTKIGFIAYRPFEKLDLLAKPSSHGTSLQSKYRFVKEECYKATKYMIHFHVEGEDESTRARFVHDEIGDGSIQAHIDEITEWFADCEVFAGKQLIWERVVKSTLSGSTRAGMTQMNLEIYLFPSRYRFKAMPRTPLPPADPAMVAWVTGGEMPPIVPRQA